MDIVDKNNLNRRQILRKSSFAGLSAGLVGKASIGAFAAENEHTPADLGIDILKGREKKSLVYDVLRMEEFASISAELRSNGWRVARSAIDAFSVERDFDETFHTLERDNSGVKEKGKQKSLKYDVVIIGFKNTGRKQPEGTEAHFVHIDGDIPEAVMPEEFNKQTFGHIGRVKEEGVVLSGTKLNAVEEEYIFAEGGGSVVTESRTFDPEEEFSDHALLQEDGVEVNGHSCVICFQDCSIGWRCALTILSTGLGVIACTAAVLLSGGLAVTLCLMGLGISGFLSWDCVSNRDCEWTSMNVTKNQWENEFPDSDKSFEEYCDHFAC